MRLVGMALLASWLVAWAVAPRGEIRPSTPSVELVAAAGADPVAVAWVESQAHGGSFLRVAIVSADGRRGDTFTTAVDEETGAFRLVDAGDGQFVLAMVHARPDGARLLDLRRLGRGRNVALPLVSLTVPVADTWRIAAADDELAVVEEVSARVILDGRHDAHATVRLPCIVHTVDEHGAWSAPETAERVLVGAGAGHVIRYDARKDGSAHVAIAPGREAGWGYDVPPSPLAHTAIGPGETLAVVGLRGGFARLVRVNATEAFIDGLRDGKPFRRSVFLQGEPAAEPLAVDAAGDLLLRERTAGAADGPQHVQIVDESGAVVQTLDPPRPKADVPVMLARMVLASATPEPVWAVEERGPVPRIGLAFPHAGQEVAVVGPTIHRAPDARPLLRALAALPLSFLLVAFVGAMARAARLRSLASEGGAGELPLAPGPATLEGVLVADAEAPAGVLRVRRGRTSVALFVEGAEVVRASELRPATEPRGDAVDVVAGSPVVATGTVEAGALYRDAVALRARRGDLVVVGCTLAEARTRASRIALATGLLLASVAAALGAAIAAG